MFPGGNAGWSLESSEPQDTQDPSFISLCTRIRVRHSAIDRTAKSRWGCCIGAFRMRRRQACPSFWRDFYAEVVSGSFPCASDCVTEGAGLSVLRRASYDSWLANTNSASNDDISWPNNVSALQSHARIY